MTALIYILDPKGVIIGTDTLSLRMNKSPYSYVTKVFPLPHLKGVICGSGSADLLVDWFSLVQKYVIGKDITILSEIVQQRLSELFNSYNFPVETTASIYHFGYNLMTKKFEGYRYKSDNNFKEEKLEYGCGIKPYGDKIFQFTNKQAKYKDYVEFIIETIKKQKRIDDSQNNTEKVGIGGNIHILSITKLYQFIWEVYEFPDYESTFIEIMKCLKENGGIVFSRTLLDAFKYLTTKLKTEFDKLND